MDETKFDPDKVAKRICKLIANSKPPNDATPACEKLIRTLNRFCSKEKQMVFLHVYVKSQHLELFRTDLDDFNPVIVVLIAKMAASVIGAKLLFKRTPWIIKKLVTFLDISDTTIAKVVTIILYNLTCAYFEKQESKWGAFFEYGIIEVILQNLWKIEWDFTEPEDVTWVQHSLQLLISPLELQKHSISTKIVSLLKPNLIRVAEPFPNDFDEDSLLFTALFGFLCRLIHFDRSIFKFVKKTKIVELAKSFDLRKPGELQMTIDLFLHLCREHCEVYTDMSTYNCVDPNSEGYTFTLKWCAADGCQESSETCKLKRCSGCVDYVTYCSKECQKSDWKIHKRLCKSLQ